MLVMSRREGETILIGEDIEILIAQIGRSRVKVGICAPRHMPVVAREVSQSMPLIDLLRRRRIVLLIGLGVVALMAGASLTHVGRPNPGTYPSARVID